MFPYLAERAYRLTQTDCYPFPLMHMVLSNRLFRHCRKNLRFVRRCRTFFILPIGATLSHFSSGEILFLTPVLRQIVPHYYVIVTIFHLFSFHRAKLQKKSQIHKYLGKKLKTIYIFIDFWQIIVTCSDTAL